MAIRSDYSLVFPFTPVFQLISLEFQYVEALLTFQGLMFLSSLSTASNLIVRSKQSERGSGDVIIIKSPAR